MKKFNQPFQPEDNYLSDGQKACLVCLTNPQIKKLGPFWKAVKDGEFRLNQEALAIAIRNQIAQAEMKN